MAKRRGAAAVAWAASKPSAKGRTRSGSWFGYCLAFVRLSYGDVPARGGSAASAWRNAKIKHGPDVPAPLGVPQFWTGGSKGYGHIVLSAGDGTVWTTDKAGPGKISRERFQDVHRWLGRSHTYVGWSEDLNGVRIISDAVRQPTPSTTRLECVIVDAWGNVVAFGPPGQSPNQYEGVGSFVPSTQAAEPFRAVWRRVPA